MSPPPQTATTLHPTRETDILSSTQHARAQFACLCTLRKWNRIVCVWLFTQHHVCEVQAAVACSWGSFTLISEWHPPGWYSRSVFLFYCGWVFMTRVQAGTLTVFLRLLVAQVHISYGYSSGSGNCRFLCVHVPTLAETAKQFSKIIVPLYILPSSV